jgi:hypothetical protein
MSIPCVFFSYSRDSELPRRINYSISGFKKLGHIHKILGVSETFMTDWIFMGLSSGQMDRLGLLA